MDLRAFLLALLALAMLLETLATSPLQQKLSTNLLEKGEKRWNWKAASEESKTEWGIVLKRYVMFDMTLLELEHLWDEGLPATTSASSTRPTFDDDTLAKIRAKVDKLHLDLEKAVLDQSTSDSTADDMQKEMRSNHLTKAEKLTLRAEHQRERYGFFSVEASAQDVLSKANAMLQALDSQRARPTSSWASILPAPTMYPSLFANGTLARGRRPGSPTVRNKTSPAGPTDPIGTLFQKYHETAKTFRTDLGNFQNMQQKATTSVLMIK